jgi:acyl-CoA synthetase (AMP-forming)/AMP-acid ligase II
MKFTQAGGKLKREIRQHFSKICRETGIRFYVMYGQTEATARIAVLPPDDFAEFDNAIGFVVPGGKLTIVDEQENQIRSPGIIGELCYEGPNVFQGYATNRSDLNLPNSSPIILKTGDLGFFDSDARFFISGRIKRIAKILGIRVNLEEVESFLATAGFEAYCIEYFGKLFVVTVTREVSQEVKAELFAYLGMNSQLISFLQIHSIPRMDSGKVDYPSILEFLGGQ